MAAKADITVETFDGKKVELTFDLRAITMGEYRKFGSGGLLEEDDDKYLSKLTGEPAEFFRDLPQPEHRRVVRAYFKKANSPIENDPND